ncbi:MAG TPA: DUF6152 family protein [Terriglobia bacterium]|nr:DUF6152 family protein [Terriglobia bacterium]
MKDHRTVLAGLFSAVVLAAPLFAHHSVTNVFDTSKSVSMKGTITKVDWRNPHASIYLDVKDASGKITNWWIEMATLANLSKAGLDQNMIDLNQTYSIEVFLSKDGSAKAVGINLIFPDSKSYDISDNYPMRPPAK